MTIKQIIYVFIFTFSITGCSHTSHFPLGQFSRYSVTAPTNLEALSNETVNGSSCAIMSNNLLLSDAVRDAISKVPGATGLRDVTIVHNAAAKAIFGVIFVPSLAFLSSCLEVSGIPVKEIVVGMNKDQKP